MFSRLTSRTRNRQTDVVAYGFGGPNRSLAVAAMLADDY